MDCPHLTPIAGHRAALELGFSAELTSQLFTVLSPTGDGTTFVVVDPAQPGHLAYFNSFVRAWMNREQVP